MTWNSVWPVGTASVKANEATGGNNTAYIETTEKVDHYWNESGNDGKHKKVTLPVLSAEPSTTANDLTLYSKNTTGGTALFFARDGVAAHTTQMTTAGITKTITATNGVTFLPSDPAVGGLLMQWGTVASPGSSSGTVSFPQAFKAATSPFSIQLTVRHASDERYAAVITISNTQFTWKASTSSAISIYWMAIGQAPD